MIMNRIRWNLAKSFHTCTTVSSHIGSKPILYSSQSTTLSHSTPTLLNVQGQLGNIQITIPPYLNLTSTPTPSTSDTPQHLDTTLTLSITDSTIKQQKAVWGLTRSLIFNAIEGTSKGYTLDLRLVGVGYRAAIDIITDTAVSPVSSSPLQRLNLKLGFAHPVLIELPRDVQATTPSTTVIQLKGIDKQRIGEIAARIRRWRAPEPYNGKGIFVGDEVVRRKEVKKK